MTESNRTAGQTRDCHGCRYWSDMIAKAEDGGPIEALCLNNKGPLSMKYTTAQMTCAGWQSGHHGPVDQWPDYGANAQQEYDLDDKMDDEHA